MEGKIYSLLRKFFQSDLTEFPQIKVTKPKR